MTGAGCIGVKIDPILWRFGLGGNGFPEGARSAGVPYFNAYAGTAYPTMRPVRRAIRRGPAHCRPREAGNLQPEGLERERHLTGGEQAGLVGPPLSQAASLQASEARTRLRAARPNEKPPRVGESDGNHVPLENRHARDDGPYLTRASAAPCAALH